MRSNHGYIMRDQVKHKVSSIMAYRFRQAASPGAVMPKPAVLVLTVIALNLLVSAFAT